MSAISDHDGRPNPRPAALVPAVRDLVARFAGLWNEGGGGRPDLGPTFTTRERSPREKAFSRFVDVIRDEAERLPSTPEDREACQKRIFGAFDRFAREGLGWQDRHLDSLLGGGFDRGAADFVRMARAFDPALGFEDIFQACRNVWVANGLQKLLGLPVQLTPSIFAYSLLYPYTDNYLDDPSATEETKQAFNGRLRSRLEGRDVAPANPREKTIFDLIAMIESDRPRSRYPQAFECLIAIHEAQAKSLRLLGTGHPPAEPDILGIVLEKGGTSVLADGCLVAGSLKPGQVEFLFGFGAFLQLMDDAEDVLEDRRAGLWTVFSRAAGREPLDGLADRALSFGGRVLAGLDRFSVPGSEPLQELIRWSLPWGLIVSAGRFRRLYRRPYLKELEGHSPFRFSFYNRQRRRLERRRAGLERLFESLASS
jgi:hypothetical protein